MIQAPIFHVNGDDPEACVRVARLAYAYRQTFHKDVVIDMVCYRRHGHNEGDDPSYTQPLMYKLIEQRRSVRKIYTEALVKRGEITIEEAEQSLDDFQRRLQVAFDETRPSAPPTVVKAARPPAPLGVLPHVATGRRARHARPHLRRAHHRARGVHDPPEAGQAVRDPVASLRAGRPGRVGHGRGARLRFAGARGHGCSAGGRRHATGHVQPAPRRPGRLRDRLARTCHSRPRRGPGPLLGVRLAAVRVRRARVRVRLLRGAQATRSCVWEAQFGDFVNGAQIIIDQFLVAAEDKWGQTSGLVHAAAARVRRAGPRALVGPDRALPAPVCRGQHAGRATPPRLPSTSTCCDARCTASAQATRDLHAEVASAREGRSFVGRRARGRLVPRGPRRPWVTDPSEVRRIVFCSGKVTYDAIGRRDETSAPVAVVRVEQLYPFPASS